jgi:uncharacterized membrane protein YphA (DoxX/SURF4 family)
MTEARRKGETIAGVAVICGMATGYAALIAAVFAFFSFNWVGAGVCLAAAGLSFGLVANAALRQ